MRYIFFAATNFLTLESHQIKKLKRSSLLQREPTRIAKISLIHHLGLIFTTLFCFFPQAFSVSNSPPSPNLNCETSLGIHPDLSLIIAETKLSESYTEQLLQIQAKQIIEEIQALSIKVKAIVYIYPPRIHPIPEALSHLKNYVYENTRNKFQVELLRKITPILLDAKEMRFPLYRGRYNPNGEALLQLPLLLDRTMLDIFDEVNSPTSLELAYWIWTSAISHFSLARDNKLDPRILKDKLYVRYSEEVAYRESENKSSTYAFSDFSNQYFAFFKKFKNANPFQMQVLRELIEASGNLALGDSDTFLNNYDLIDVLKNNWQIMALKEIHFLRSESSFDQPKLEPKGFEDWSLFYNRAILRSVLESIADIDNKVAYDSFIFSARIHDSFKEHWNIPELKYWPFDVSKFNKDSKILTPWTITGETWKYDENGAIVPSQNSRYPFAGSPTYNLHWMKTTKAVPLNIRPTFESYND